MHWFIHWYDNWEWNWYAYFSVSFFSFLWYIINEVNELSHPDNQYKTWKSVELAGPFLGALCWLILLVAAILIIPVIIWSDSPSIMQMLIDWLKKKRHEARSRK